MFAALNPGQPPAPKLYSKGVMITNITQVFTNAAHRVLPITKPKESGYRSRANDFDIELEVGDLVKDPFFTLFDAVAALEIMDPKMDSGYLAPGETMEDEYDFAQALLPEEVLGIIDQLLCHENASSLTILYVDRILYPSPSSLNETFFDRSESCDGDEPLMLQVLRAYCLGLIKTCWYVNNRVRSGHFYEEEDFATHTFHRNLLEGIDYDEILHFLEETRELVAQTQAIPEDMKEALTTRLTFRYTFLRAVDIADSRSPDAKVFWRETLLFIPDLRSSNKLAKSAPQSFSVKLQRKLASTVPPRPIVDVGQQSAYEHLERMCKDGEIAVDIFDYADSHSLMTFVSLFQARKPQPSVYIRTLLQYYMFADMIILGKMSIREVLDDDLASLTLPANQLLDRNNDEIEVPHDPRFHMAQRMELFRSRAASTYIDILRTMCQNRCRIRRTLCHTIVDWDNLQLDGEELDQELREFTKEEPFMDLDISSDPIFAFHLSSWAYYYKLRQMEWIVQLGFELQIYQPDELSGMYYYLNYLCKTRSRHLERIRSEVMRSYSARRQESHLDTSQQTEFANAISYINFSMLEVTSTYGFADALSSLFEALRRLDLIPIPPRPYGNDIMRYEVRMKPFSTIGLPAPMAFDTFTYNVTQPKESTLDLLMIAAEATSAAKKGFEILSKLNPKDAYCRGSHERWVKDIKNCLKACIFTGISIAAVKKAIEAAGKDSDVKIQVEIPPTGKGYHDWWVVPKILPGQKR
ncbi:N-alpha-acetyltransferase, non-catalitic subunit [Ciborinia camelliae]|nr:N-alpha-acetyltransferase, non-catalitic subunit [Ciborinia camelliae]